MSRGFIDIANNFKTDAWELVQRTEAGSTERLGGVKRLMEIADSRLPGARLLLRPPDYGGRIAERVIGATRALLTETVRTKRRGDNRWLNLEGKLNDAINDAIGDGGMMSIEPSKTVGKSKPGAVQRSAKPVRRNRAVSPKPITPRQMEIVQIVLEHNGNIAAAARALGCDRKTVKEAYDAGLKKLGRIALPKAKTVPMRNDRRGQVDLSKDRR